MFKYSSKSLRIQIQNSNLNAKDKDKDKGELEVEFRRISLTGFRICTSRSHYWSVSKQTTALDVDLVYEVLVLSRAIRDRCLTSCYRSKKLKGTTALLRREGYTQAHSSPFTIHSRSNKMYRDLKTDTFGGTALSTDESYPLEIPVGNGMRFPWISVTGLSYHSEKDMMRFGWFLIGYQVCYISYPSIRKTMYINFHPQTDGQSERDHSDLANILGLELNGTGCWDEYLCMVEVLPTIIDWHASFRQHLSSLLFRLICPLSEDLNHSGRQRESEKQSYPFVKILLGRITPERELPETKSPYAR
ncbi:hypothetical protein Tco_1275774 [Tanacetum coccineum]